MTLVTEAISVTTTSASGVTAVLDNDMLVPKGFIGTISKDGTDVKFSSCFSDGTKNKSLSTSYSTSKNTDIDGSNSILCYENGVLKVKGTTDLSVTGEVAFNFSTVTAGYTIAGLVIGEVA